MRRTSVGFRLAVTLGALAIVAPASTVAAQYPAPSDQSPQQPTLYTVDELDNLLAPVALYPDPILAQVLVAATYPDQIALAARYVRIYGERDIDRQGWDVSVKSVAHYRPVLNMLAESPDWATALGQAYALQPGDVMASVQGLREMAYAQGNLVSTAEQRVEYAPRAIRIVPAQARVIYVPTYDPEIIYYRPVHYARARTPYWSFGIAFPIGVWLTYDMDWDRHDIYYHGWHGYGRQHSWFHVSRPFIVFNTVYVNPYRTVVVINRNVVHHHVTYINFNRYNTVHRKVAWDRRDLPGRGNHAQRGRRGGGDDERREAPSRRIAQDAKVPKSVPETDRVIPTRIGGNSRPLYPARTASDEYRAAQPRAALPRSAPDFKPPKTSASQSTAARAAPRTDPRTAPAPVRSGSTYSAPPRTGGTYSAPRSNGTYSAPRSNGTYSAPSRSNGTSASPAQAPQSDRSSPARSGVARGAPSTPGASSSPRAPRASSDPVKSQGKPQARPSSEGSSDAPTRSAKPSGKERPDDERSPAP